MTAQAGPAPDDVPLLAPSAGFQVAAEFRVPDLASTRAVSCRTTQFVHLGEDEVEVQRAAGRDESRRSGPPFPDDHAYREPNGDRLPPPRLGAHHSHAVAEWFADHIHPAAVAADIPGAS